MLILKIVRRCPMVKGFPQWHAHNKASVYKRPQSNVPREQLQTLSAELFQQRSNLSNSEWKEIQQMLTSNYKHINVNNVDAVIVGLCKDPEQLPLAKDYVRYLRENGIEPNTATLGRLLRVYNAVYHAEGGDDTALSAAEQEDIIDIYESLRQRYEVLDATTCENVIYGLVTTARWREGEQLLQMTKLTSTPSVNAYTELIVKAFSKDELEFGWQLLEEMLELRKQPKCEILVAYLKQIAKNVSTFRGHFERLLEFLGRHDITITAKVANYIMQLARELPAAALTVQDTHVTRRGKCDHCALVMQNIAISDLEFARLSNSFLNKVLIRNDVFQKSTPEEVERFKRFVTQTAPYGCVIDGLNVAYSMGTKKSPAALAKLLANVVKYFTDKQKHVLVLGRKHMNSWPKDVMQFIRKNASLFLTNNLSQDDPFLLYATLKSGQSTDFCSRDLMRQHAFLLGPELRTVFRRWQQEHQYVLLTQTSSGKIIIKEPIRHLIYAHKVQTHWHVPYKPDYSANPPEVFELPEHWLCIEFQKIK